MKHPNVVHKNKSTYTVSISRPCPIWGNKYVIGIHGTRSEVKAKFKDDLRNRVLSGEVPLADLMALEYETLGCYCRPLACHGDDIMDLIEEFKVEKLV